MTPTLISFLGKDFLIIVHYIDFCFLFNLYSLDVGVEKSCFLGGFGFDK